MNIWDARILDIASEYGKEYEWPQYPNAYNRKWIWSKAKLTEQELTFLADIDVDYQMKYYDDPIQQIVSIFEDHEEYLSKFKVKHNRR